jgi:hypothetical protein
MKSFPEAEAITAIRCALDEYRTREWNTVQYLWEAIGEGLRWDEKAVESLSGEEECLVVFDPNEWNLAERIKFAALVQLEGSIIAFQCTREKLKTMFSRASFGEADFYVLDAHGKFLGLRSHEDEASLTGMWVPLPKSRPNQPVQRTGASARR